MPAEKTPARRRRAAPPPAETTAKLSVTHDRLTLAVRFANGDVLRIRITRSGERFTVSGPLTGSPTSDARLRAVAAGLKPRGGENNQQRLERVGRVAAGCADLPALAAALAAYPADPAPPAGW